MKNEREKLYDYELVPFGHNFADAMPRKYLMFRFTESEAQEKNQAYALNKVQKRLVRVKARFN